MGYTVRLSDNLPIEDSRIRENVNTVMKNTNKYGSQRPLILPVEWRSTLRLDDGIIDRITLPKMKDLRGYFTYI